MSDLLVQQRFGHPRLGFYNALEQLQVAVQGINSQTIEGHGDDNPYGVLGEVEVQADCISTHVDESLLSRAREI